MKNDLTALDFLGKPVWTSGTDDERAARLRAYEATGMEPEELAEMKNAGHEAGRRLTRADLIDRSQFDEYKGTVPEGMDVGSYIAGARAVFEAIGNAETVDAVQVVHARWRQEDEDAWACTACGNMWTFLDGGPAENEANYCPKCGAKMGLDGSDNE